MGMEALQWCRPVQCSPTQKVVLWALADQANDRTAEAWPSIAGLMEATCLSERSVRGALRELEVLGLIMTTPGGGRYRTSVYRLAMTPKGAADAESRQEMPRLPEPEKGQLLPERGHLVPKRGHVVQEKGHHVPPNPQNPIEPNRTQTLVLAPSPSGCGFDAWWAAYPRKIGKDAARTAYVAALKRGATDAILLEAIRRHRWPDEMRFIPHARTWLTQGRWQDDPRQAATREPKREALQDTIADIMRDPFGGSARTPGFDFDGHAEEAPT